MDSFCLVAEIHWLWSAIQFYYVYYKAEYAAVVLLC